MTICRSRRIRWGDALAAVHIDFRRIRWSTGDSDGSPRSGHPARAEPLVATRSWLALAAVASICWFILIPMTRRTHDPVGEGLVFAFLIRWGPLFALAWLLFQELLAWH